MHQQQAPAGSGPDDFLSTASRAEQATESSSTVEAEVRAVSPAEIAAQLEAATRSSSTGGGSETAAHLQAAAESSSTVEAERGQQHTWGQQQRAAAQVEAAVG